MSTPDSGPGASSRRSRWRRLVPLVAAVAALASTAATCDTPDGSLLGPLATINYEQIGACLRYREAASDTSPSGGLGPHTAYVVFRISTIDNTASGARDLHFDPSRLYLNGDPRLYADPTLRAWTLDPFGAQAGLMRAGLVTSINGAVYVVVDTVQPDGLTEATRTAYSLLHDTAQDSQGVLMAKQNPNRTSWPRTEFCDQIVH